jgi:hypothetical protein
VVFAVIDTGVEKVTVCHPDAVSPVNVAVANCAPERVHSVPVWVPVVVMPL